MSRRSQTLRRGKVEVEEVRERDHDGKIVAHYRTIDALARLARSGVIDEAMHDAARDFQAAFTIANLEPLRAMPIQRLPGTGREPSLTERQVFTRRRVHRVLEALGGHASPAGSVIWHVVGGGMSVRQWALRQRWGGRAMRVDEGQGVLVAALGVLAARHGGAAGRWPAI